MSYFHWPTTRISVISEENSQGAGIAGSRRRDAGATLVPVPGPALVPGGPPSVGVMTRAPSR
jgi:hypothetical protein